MLVFRRFLVLVALMFWLGGFTFYAGVVVPIGRGVLGSAQSEVTREVSFYLNVSAAFALLPLTWDNLFAHDPLRRRRVLRWLCCLVVLATLIVLVWLRADLVEMLDHPVGGTLTSHAPFRQGHRLYLWISTLQWGAGVLYTLATIRAWRGEDSLSIYPDEHGSQPKRLNDLTGAADSPHIVPRPE
jgi:hypothetical protein